MQMRMKLPLLPARSTCSHNAKLSHTQVELGLNMKGVKATTRLIEQPEKSMCQYKVRLASVAEVDKELIAWLKLAYDAAG